LVFFQALEGIFTIVIMVSVGYILTAKKWFDQDNAKLLPKLINYIALPPYMIWNLLSTFERDNFLLLLGGVLVPAVAMTLNYLIGWLVSVALKITPSRRGTFRAAFFCSSSIFVGLPVNAALFGESSIPYVLIYFLSNAFLFWTVGNYSISLDGKTAPARIISRETVGRVFSPPLIGFAVAVLLVLGEVHLPKFVLQTARYLGGMTIPLSMMFIGITMFGVKLREITLSKDILAVLLGRFVVAPLAVVAVTWLIPIPMLMKKVFIIQSALPVMTQATVMAKVYEADTEYAALLVTITTLAAMMAIPVYMILM